MESANRKPIVRSGLAGQRNDRLDSIWDRHIRHDTDQGIVAGTFVGVVDNTARCWHRVQHAGDPGRANAHRLRRECIR